MEFLSQERKQSKQMCSCLLACTHFLKVHFPRGTDYSHMKCHLLPDAMYILLSVCSSIEEKENGEGGSRGDNALPVTVYSAFSFWMPITPGRKGVASGDKRTALHFQLAGLLVQREFLQIQGTSCCGGKSAEEKQKEGKSKSSPGKQLFLRKLRYSAYRPT